MNDSSLIKFGLTQKQYQLIEEAIIAFDEIEKVVIFGSRATGQYAPSSDIDLAVFGKNITTNTTSRFFSRLDDLPLPFKFDVLNYERISSTTLKNKIDLQGKVFFQKQLNTAS